MTITAEVLIILALIFLNGLFAMAEFAMVSAKKALLRQRAEEGDAKAAAALSIAREPTRFLSTIQIGITLIGILAGAFGGATVAKGLEIYIAKFPLLAPYSGILAITLVVLAITYLSLVFGELVPKHLALSNAEDIASATARPMGILATVAAPLVFVLSWSTGIVLRILRIRRTVEPPVTEEEIKILLREGTEAGIFEKSELSMVQEVFHLGDMHAESLMTPRPDIISLDLNDPAAENLRKMTESGLSNFPAHEGDLDNIVGMVSVKDVLARMAGGCVPDLRASVTQPLYVPETIPALKLLEQFRETGVHIAVLTDEYGSVRGVITLQDILEAIVGEVRSRGEPAESPIVTREDGSLLISGTTPIADVQRALHAGPFPGGEREYRTIAGLILFFLQRVPKTGDRFPLAGLQFEVVDMDGNRIDKVLVTRLPSLSQDMELPAERRSP